jgi:hypothetical protein
MSYLEMSLPTDIPWKRLAASRDMIDRTYGDLKFPPKWRSSIAVFYHEPADLPPEFCNRRITYLKVVASITNFQWGEEDSKAMEALRESFSEYKAWPTLGTALGDSYPCYGALLQLGVYPNPADRVPLHDYPYITDFEPKKREMYEMASSSGEVLSGSTNQLNVGKRDVSTESQEIRNIFKGYSKTEEGTAGQSFLFGAYSYGGKPGGSYSEAGEWGTIDAYGREATSSHAVDASREKRETHSFTTNISQLHTMLQGYHLGTNRALFFLQPRPHIQDSRFTFVQGLRRLEGIQEFFFIVDRPKTVPGICIEVALETAHLYQRRTYLPRLIPYNALYVNDNLNKTAAARGIHPASRADYWGMEQLARNWNKFSPWVRIITAITQEESPGYLTKRISDALNSWEEWGDLKTVLGYLPDIGAERVAVIYEEAVSENGTLFLTARRACGCIKTSAIEEQLEAETSVESNLCPYPSFPSIVFWEDVQLPELVYKAHGYSPHLGIKFPALQANRLLEKIRENLALSLNDPRRLPYGEATFLNSELVARELRLVVKDIKGGSIMRSGSVMKIKGIDRGFLERIRSSGVETAAAASELDIEALSKVLNIPRLEARVIRVRLIAGAAMLGEKWTPPESRPGPFGIEDGGRVPAKGRSLPGRG